MPTARKNARSAPATNPEGGLEPPTDLIYQALETEMGGVEIYMTALQCVVRTDLRKEWEKYLAQTRTHVKIVRTLCEHLGLDPDRETPSRHVVRHIGKALVGAMRRARGAGNPEAAEIVAAECVTLAETKDHANWALIAKLAESASGKNKKALTDAADQVEDEEDEHLYHSAGWARELWLDALGLPAQLPPPEEEEDVRSEEEAVHARKKGREAGAGD